MSQILITLPDMQARVESLAERQATLEAKFQARLGSRAFKNASAEDQAKTLVAGALLRTLSVPVKTLVEAIVPLLPPPEGTNAFADIAADHADGVLKAAGIKKDALILSFAGANNVLLPLLEQLATEAEEKLA